MMTNEKSFKIKKESVNIEILSNNTFNIKNYIHISDNSNNNYLYSLNSNRYYEINYNPFITFSEKSMSHTDDERPEITLVGNLSSDNIIYGYSNDDENLPLIFISFPKNNIAYCEIYEMINHISCKLIEDIQFICIYNKDKSKDKLYIHFMSYNIDSDKSLIHSYNNPNNFNNLSNSYVSSFNLYDTEENDIKLLYMQNEQNIQCKFFQAIITNRSSIILGDDNLIFEISDSFSEKIVILLN